MIALPHQLVILGELAIACRLRLISYYVVLLQISSFVLRKRASDSHQTIIYREILLQFRFFWTNVVQ